MKCPQLMLVIINLPILRLVSEHFYTRFPKIHATQIKAKEAQGVSKLALGNILFVARLLPLNFILRPIVVEPVCNGVAIDTLPL